ncbi:bile acid:sodium symporter family protein [Methylobacter svalbardensis]|uniref:bile acid:sodium symporter family protein n=1 Tax=Methylobacter svalbardensis TaxID=3080016 RepID=UPI0030EEE9E8
MLKVWQRNCIKIAEWFPLWIVTGCLWAWWQPEAWLWFQPYIAVGLGVIMLGMGLTLRLADFSAVLRMPKIVAIGIFMQFAIMPLAAYFWARVLDLEAGLAIGLILVGSCPGGTASNVICYLARANVALSVLLTLCSTLAAVVMTPLLTQWLAGAYLPIDGWGLFRSMLVVVLIPLLAGLLINTALDRIQQHKRHAVRAVVHAVGPVVSVIVIVLVVGSIMAGNKAAIGVAGPKLFASVFLLHATGFSLGYLVMKWLGYGKAESRTVSIEVGMQNSGLGAALAKTHFASMAMAPVPAAISAVFHCLIGSALAGVWGRRK